MPGVLDLAPGLRDFSDTAAAIACMDLVIGVETAVTHLAGAMGTPAWLMLAHRPDWRWGMTGETTPWYASARLFRQRRTDDWASVTQAIAAALAAR
jgi:ADP-heptose:LPS heptosyltransferase